MTNNQFSDWLDGVTKKALLNYEEKHLTLQKEAVGNTRQDMSRPVLESLLENGYNLVEWDSGSSTCGKCVELNHQKWELQDFTTNVPYDAPIFSRSHPGDRSCTLTVSGPDLPTVRVDSYGNVEEI